MIAQPALQAGEHRAREGAVLRVRADATIADNEGTCGNLVPNTWRGTPGVASVRPRCQARRARARGALDSVDHIPYYRI